MKKTRIAWGRLFSYSAIVICLALALIVGMFALADKLQRVADENKTLQEVYPIYQDDDVMCYRISKGVDLKGMWHDEVQQCLKK
jgi:hypothetical protein